MNANMLLVVYDGRHSYLDSHQVMGKIHRTQPTFDMLILSDLV